MPKYAHYQHMRGIEREALRIDALGEISQSFHPHALGSKLCNDHITVDFAESLLELITDPHTSIDDTFKSLQNISAFTVQHLNRNELMLNTSMPLPTYEEKVAIAYFGESHSGKMKEVYRRGLTARYGKIMQAIAGIHYNFSFDPKLITNLGKDNNELYFHVINQYFEFMWLLPYFFGASPICARTSVKHKPDFLAELDDRYYIGEYATSLRMSKLGYQSPAQDSLYISHKDLHGYVHDLIKATDTPYAPFEQIGIHNAYGQRQQLNTHILQIENEYYSSIRPKQIVKRGERPACALLHRGVRYIEVRVMDVNPFETLGISRDSALFIEAMLMTCIHRKQQPYCVENTQRHRANFTTTVEQGRNPDVTLLDSQRKAIALAQYGHQLLDEIETVATEMGDDYLSAVHAQRQKLDHPELTLSGQILTLLKDFPNYTDMMMALSQQAHQQLMNTKVDVDINLQLQAEVEQSLATQATLEAQNCDLDLDEYIARYYQSACCDDARLA